MQLTCKASSSTKPSIERDLRMGKDFDFDSYAQTATFGEICSRMIESRRLPSMTSPDGAWLYLSSLDYQVETDDAQTMRAFLEEITERLPVLKADVNLNHSKINDYEIDQAELESRLQYL